MTVPPGSQPSGLRARIDAALRGWMRWPRRVRLLVAGYAALMLFAITAGVTRWLAGATPRVALIAGAAVVAPLVFAYFGDRITGVKALGVEVSLADVAVRVNVDVSRAVMIIAHTGGSGSLELVDSFKSVIQERARMLQLDLQANDYWWSTRLYLVASIAVDFTEVERLVFVRNGDRFVGLAEPSAVRRRLSSRFPAYQVAYRKLQGELADGIKRNQEQELKEILMYRWETLFNGEEKNVTEIVTAGKLSMWLPTELDGDSLPHGPLTPLLRYQIVTRPHRYTALSTAGRLIEIVDRAELAVRTTEAVLQRELT